MAQECPDIYTDQFRFAASPYGVTLTFYRTLPAEKPEEPGGAEKVLTLRMSLEHAKKMTMILMAQLKIIEEQMLKAPIPLPPEQQEPPKA